MSQFGVHGIKMLNLKISYAFEYQRSYKGGADKTFSPHIQAIFFIQRLHKFKQERVGVQKKSHILCGTAVYPCINVSFFGNASNVISTVSVIRIISADIYGLFMHARPHFSGSVVKVWILGR
jgi:hypothetical protein